ncbi:acidic mammalian chitinase-like [Neocloeon triangulifer]|uniref:acidic mammalian chitinase-like n=1 Tax=Neocloeon triangulifer TaxID=2078957 RepID=UPI00286FA384|nr:acidic mammalian chitinase-like [Neocloeon triangulifer]
MLSAKSLLLSATLLVVLASSATAQKRVVCYFSSWATYRSGDGKFEAENIDPFLCTHAIYAFVGVNAHDATVRIIDPWNDISLNGFKRFNNLRLTNPNLKTMVAIGGWNEASVGFSNVCKDPVLRARFVDNLVNFVKTYGFNGLDLDWEFPAQRGGISADKNNFAALVRELRAKFTPNGLILSAAVSAGLWAASVSYDIPQLSANLDFINLMTYDYHGSWESRTGENAPIYASSVDSDQGLNVQSTLNYWLQQGAARSKLVLGVPTYGRSFTLQSSGNNGVGAPTIGAGNPGQYSQEAGILLYHEICQLQRSQGAAFNYRWNGQQQVPYAFWGNQWVGYDNIDSVRIKGQFAKNNNLGGVMVYALEMDDFRNTCAAGRYPLLTTLRAAYL